MSEEKRLVIEQINEWVRKGYDLIVIYNQLGRDKKPTTQQEAYDLLVEEVNKRRS